MENTHTSAVIYSRVSTLDQNPERQEKELRQYATNNNIQVLGVFEDSITGTSEQSKRAGFEKMLHFIEANSIKLILVHELTRLGRSLRNALNIIDDLRGKDINIYFYTENLNTITTDYTKQLNLNLLSSIAEYSRNVIKANTISGTYNAIKNGGVGAGAIKQYGYKKLAGKMVIDEDEAAIIRDICDKYLNADWSLETIADYLNENGVGTRYKKLIAKGDITYSKASKLQWTSGSVGRLLHKRLLTGFRVYGKIELQDEAFRIISDETFNAIQVKMAGKRRTVANAQKYEAILRGTLVCGHCGGTVVMHKGKSKVANHYKCYNRFTVKSGCNDAKMINIDLLNNTVYLQTIGFKIDSDVVLAKIAENEDRINQNRISINQIDKKVADEVKGKGKLVDLFTADVIDISLYKVKLAGIESNIKALAVKKEEALNQIQKLIDENNLLNEKKNVDLKNPVIFKENIKKLVKKVELSSLSDADIAAYNEQVVVDFYTPHAEQLKRNTPSEIIYKVCTTMFDDKNVYTSYVSSKMKFNKFITIERK